MKKGKRIIVFLLVIIIGLVSTPAAVFQAADQISADTVVDEINKNRITYDQGRYRYSLDLTKESSDSFGIALLDLEQINKDKPYHDLYVKTANSGVYFPMDITELIADIDDILKNGQVQKDHAGIFFAIKAENDNQELNQAIAKLPKGKLLSAPVNISVSLYDRRTKNVIKRITQLDNLRLVLPVSEKYPDFFGGFQWSESDKKLKFVSHRNNSFDDREAMTVSVRKPGTYLIAQNEQEYKDVEGTAAYKKYVKTAVSKKLITGKSASKFQQKTAMTKGEFAYLLAEALDLPKADANTKKYTDVKTNNKYYDGINRARSAGILNHFNETKFEPDKAITREEMSAMLNDVILYTNTAVTDDYIIVEDRFKDYSKVDDRFKGTLQFTIKLKLMPGLEKENFNPKGKVSRGQTAYVLIRIMKASFQIDQ